MIKHWINGREVESKDVFENYNPATGELIGEVASGGAAEIDAAVAAAREAFPKWANTPAKERARLMRRLGELIDRNVPHLAELETLDTGLPIHQTKNVLIPRASHNFEFFAEVCTRMNGHSYPVDDQMLNYTLYQPVGVCGLVSPWNVPFMTATWKTAPCLALGNTAVLKMSELSPLTANELGRLVHEAGIPPGVFNVVQGYGASAGDALVRHRDVRARRETPGLPPPCRGSRRCRTGRSPPPRNSARKAARAGRRSGAGRRTRYPCPRRPWRSRWSSPPGSSMAGCGSCR